MAITRSQEFYAGNKTVRKKSFFGGTFMDYEFTLDIAYKDLTYADGVKQLQEFMESHDIKIAYLDIATDFGGGYSLCKRYKFYNKKGHIITKPQKYNY